MNIYLKAILTIPLLLGILYGCNNDVDQDERVTNPATTNETTNNATSQTDGANATDNQKQGEQNVNTPYNFTHFDLDVDYANDITYNAEYANDQKGMSAEIEDEINQVDLRGDDAYNKLVKNFELLTFDANSKDQDVLNQVLTAFNLDENFTEFDLEVKFVNGDVKEYKFKK